MTRASCARCGATLTPDLLAIRATTCGACVQKPQESEEARRTRLHLARVEHIRQSWERGRRCLLARALDPQNQTWARIDH